SRAAGNTYSESSAVIAILHNLNISFQHRDVLLSRSYLEEIRDISGKCVSLPQLFMRGKCVGGYERIMELNERGKLKKLLGGYVNKSPREVCKGCGDMRHIVCFVCSGSKIFYREDLDEMASCNICNENGLLPCPACLMGAIQPKNQVNSPGQ
ncbi:hypothetical protein KI387_025581, partial [Taxus chinensis]